MKGFFAGHEGSERSGEGEPVAGISVLIALSNDTNYHKFPQKEPGLRRLRVPSYTCCPPHYATLMRATLAMLMRATLADLVGALPRAPPAPPTRPA
jgi:hypothetical protein